MHVYQACANYPAATSGQAGQSGQGGQGVTTENTPVNGDFEAIWTTASVGLMTHSDDAITALSGPRYSIVDAPRHVPPLPGLYAVYGDAEAWTALSLEPKPDLPLYVGKAEDSLARRELQGHFAVNPGRRAQTGSSTVRRSFAALLRDFLGLHAQPRNPAKPGYFANYGLTDASDAALTEWMHARLSIAVWPTPVPLTKPLVSVERAAIRHWTPPLNLSENPRPAPGLKAARAVMAAEARAWKPNL